MSSSEFHHYTRDEFLAEFYPDSADKAAIAAGMEQLRATDLCTRRCETGESGEDQRRRWATAAPAFTQR